MLRITEQRTPDRIVLKLEGRVSNGFTPEIDACWQRVIASSGTAPIWVDLSDVCLVDSAGQALLTRMYQAGARFITRGCLMRELVREISES